MLSDLIYIQYNLRIRAKMNTTRKDGKKRDILLAKDTRRYVAWLVKECNSMDENEYYFLKTNVPFKGCFRGSRCRRVLAASKDNKEDKRSFYYRRPWDSSWDDEGECGLRFEWRGYPLDDDETDEDALRDEIFPLCTASNNNQLALYR